MSKNVADHTEAIHISPQLLTLGLIKFFFKKLSEKYFTKYSWANAHENLKNMPNSYKIAPKFPKMSLFIVRLYILLHNSLQWVL